MTNTLINDVVEDAAMIADTLGLTFRFSQPRGARQLTVYGPDYDGTDRSSRLKKATDKVRVTDYRSHAIILSLTGNNARTGEKRYAAANEPDREQLTEMLIDALGALE